MGWTYGVMGETQITASRAMLSGRRTGVLCITALGLDKPAGGGGGGGRAEPGRWFEI